MMRLGVWNAAWLVGLVVSWSAQAGQLMYRDFWYPMYHAERLDYCLIPGQQCGHVVANRYCRLMGYRRAKTEQIEHHVGLTHYLQQRSQCKGWQCDSFQLITCEGPLASDATASYLRRTRVFAQPRKDNYRVAWCYDANPKHCGKRAAYAFCRWMGYSNASHYTAEKKLPATKSLGDKVLCFGMDCTGFANITCHR